MQFDEPDHPSLGKRSLKAATSLVSALGLNAPRWLLLPPLGPAVGDSGRFFGFRLINESAPILEFRSGQYVFLSFPAHPILKDVRPLYIASAPSEHRWLEFRVQDRDDWTYALKTLLKETGADERPQLRARLAGPFGGFCHSLYASSTRLVFLCSGMGAVPALSMIRDLADNRRGARVLLLWEGENREVISGRDDLLLAGDRLELFSCLPVFSHDPLWTGEKGILDGEKLRRLVPAFFGFDRDAFEWNLASFWVSGPAAFTKRMADDLASFGVHSRAIHREGW